MANDFYNVLGVARGSSEKEIRSAYRRLARQYHPDVNPGNAQAEERFKAINAAYEVLSDGDSRKKYDRHGDQWQHADQIEQMRRQRGGGQPFGFGDLGDLAERFGGGQRGQPGQPGQRGGGIFDSLFGRAAGRQRGADVEHTVRVSLEEAFSGATRTVEVTEGVETCRICGGEGQLAGATCHACRGSGSAAPVRRIEVAIPAGVAEGTRIRVAGKGGPGGNGGASGDLFLRVEMRRHSRFERRDDDLHLVVEVPVAEAALGSEVRVPSLQGKTLALRVPPGTQSGRTFRLAGQGMPRSGRSGGHGGRFGDLHVQVQLVLPDPITAEQRELFERLQASTEQSGGAPGAAADTARETS